MNEIAKRIMLQQLDKQIPKELVKIARAWAKKANAYGDKGACVAGAGFAYEYGGERYFLPPNSRWQGSRSWEVFREDVHALLSKAGATNITYRWGMAS